MSIGRSSRRSRRRRMESQRAASGRRPRGVCADFEPTRRPGAGAFMLDRVSAESERTVQARFRACRRVTAKDCKSKPKKERHIKGTAWPRPI